MVKIPSQLSKNMCSDITCHTTENHKIVVNYFDWKTIAIWLIINFEWFQFNFHDIISFETYSTSLSRDYLVDDLSRASSLWYPMSGSSFTIFVLFANLISHIILVWLIMISILFMFNFNDIRLLNLLYKSLARLSS